MINNQNKKFYELESIRIKRNEQKANLNKQNYDHLWNRRNRLGTEPVCQKVAQHTIQT